MMTILKSLKRSWRILPTNLPRGLYAVKIAKYKEDKLVNDSGVYYVKIDNHEVVINCCKN